MKSVHRVKIGDSRDIGFIGDRSVDMVVTSPPYPMIGMWDEVFGAQSEEFKEGIMEGNGEKAFEAAHEELDKVWRECWRVLKEGKIYTENILRDVIAREDGFCWGWEDENGQEHSVYVTKCV